MKTEETSKRRLTRDEKKQLLFSLVETLPDRPSTPAEATPTESRLYRITPESRKVLDFFDTDIDFTDVFICAECFELRGSWKSHGEIFRQRCRCEEATSAAPDKTWFALDFNKLCELCYCRGSELVESGFESSVWFCDECRQRVEELNLASDRCVIPMGRFDSVDRDDAVVKLHSWMRHISGVNAQARGFSEGDQVPLVRYLESLAARPIYKRRAFEQLCAFLRIDADESR